MSKRTIVLLVVGVLVLVALIVTQPFKWDVKYTHDQQSNYDVNMDLISYETAEDYPAVMLEDAIDSESETTVEGPITEFRGHCGPRCKRQAKVNQYHIRKHHGETHHYTMNRHGTLARGTVRISCRTERGTINGGNGVWTLVNASGSIYRCWVPATNRILGPGAPQRFRPSINHECGVTAAGTASLWHCSNQGVLTADTDGWHCEGTKCWEYLFRRWSFEWGQGIHTRWVSIERHASCFVQVTANGLGEGQAGRCPQ